MADAGEKGRATFYPDDRAGWRRWLAENHDRSKGVWLVYDKKGGARRNLTYDDAVEEALCFGWIDSVVNKLDAARWQQLFSPRKPKSPWSRLNKTRVARLTEQGLLAPPGIEKIEAARRDGSWTLIDDVEDLKIPPDLDAALGANATARAHFLAFAPSSRKGILQWISSAKRPETRAKRVAETVAKAAENVRANYPVKGKG